MRIWTHVRRIEISPSFFLFLCAYYYFDPWQSFTPFLLSVVAHEFGHLMVLKLLGVHINKLCFGVAGAIICTNPLPYRQELLAAAAGPSVNLLLLALFIHQAPVLSFVNLCLLFYNLLPFYPLDGGRILRALLSLMLSERTASLLERTIASLCVLFLICIACYLTCVYHVGLWPVLICGVLLLRISGVIFPQKRVDKLHSPC